MMRAQSVEKNIFKERKKNHSWKYGAGKSVEQLFIFLVWPYIDLTLEHPLHHPLSASPRLCTISLSGICALFTRPIKLHALITFN